MDGASDGPVDGSEDGSFEGSREGSTEGVVSRVCSCRLSSACSFVILPVSFFCVMGSTVVFQGAQLSEVVISVKLQT